MRKINEEDSNLGNRAQHEMACPGEDTYRTDIAIPQQVYGRLEEALCLPQTAQTPGALFPVLARLRAKQSQKNGRKISVNTKKCSHSGLSRPRSLKGQAV